MKDKELGDYLRQVQIIYGVSPGKSLEQYYLFMNRGMLGGTKSSAKCLNPDIALKKAYDFYAKEFGY